MSLLIICLLSISVLGESTMSESGDSAELKSILSNELAKTLGKEDAVMYRWRGRTHNKRGRCIADRFRVRKRCASWKAQGMCRIYSVRRVCCVTCANIPTCKCQLFRSNSRKGHWCWLRQNKRRTTCRTLDGVKRKWRWARCVYRGTPMIRCPSTRSDSEEEIGFTPSCAAITKTGMHCNGHCMNGNHGYASLAQAENRCNQLQSCFYIMRYSNGRYYLRKQNGIRTANNAYTLYSCKSSCTSTSNMGMHCNVHCINGNHGYSSLAQAENRCSQLQNCFYIMRYSNGRYYLRKQNDRRTRNRAFTLYSCKKSSCSATSNMGMHCNGHCMNGNHGYASLAGAESRCKQLQNCHYIMRYSNDRYYLRKQNGVRVANKAYTLYTCNSKAAVEQDDESQVSDQSALVVGHEQTVSSHGRRRHGRRRRRWHKLFHARRRRRRRVWTNANAFGEEDDESKISDTPDLTVENGSS